MVTDDLYSDLLKRRRIFVGQEIDDAVANIVVAQMLFLEAEDQAKDIELHLRSPGGSVTAALAVYDTIKDMKCPVATFCAGGAAGVAVLLLAAGAPGKRAATPHASVALRRPRSLDVGVGDASVQASELARLTLKLEELLAENAQQPVERIRRDMRDKLVLNADEARDYGLIDRVEIPGRPRSP